jgi:putative DNA primase/helicase
METFDQGEDAAKDIRGASSQDGCAQDEAARIAKARAIWTESGPIDDTPGRAYLSGREIDRVPDGIARWHEGGGKDGGKSLKNDPALLFAATSEDGEIRAVQVLFFGPGGKPRIGRKGKKSRYTFGVHKDAALRLPGEGGLLATESSEDALSLWLATGRPVLAAFGDGMFGKLPVPDGEPVVIVADNDDTHDNSLKSARKAAKAFSERGCRVSIAMPPPGGVKKPNGDDVKDSNDLLVARGADAVRAMVAAAVPYATAACDDSAGSGGETISDAEFAATIKKLAGMSAAQYERARIGEAKRLGARVSVLDNLVADERPPGDGKASQGSPLEFPEPEPWPEPVDGAALLDEIEATISRFIVCEPAARGAMALWSCATWFEPVAQVAPILNITSPEMRCGKSTALSVTRKLVKRPLTSANISPAALFRTIEKHSPTLLIDEADSFLGENEELRGLINSGHTRDTSFVIRTVGDDHESKCFSTWAFKAIAGIGKVAATIEDRSITISLKRKLCGDKVERLRHANPGLFETPTRTLARFAEDSGKAVAEARPHLPEALNDREQDTGNC